MDQYFGSCLISEGKIGKVGVSDFAHFLRLSLLKLFRISNYLSVDSQVCENQTKWRQNPFDE